MLEQHSQQNQSISLSEWIRSVPLDNPKGRDSFESLFRCFSSDGMNLQSSDEIGSGTSGSYSHHIFKFAAEKLFGVDLWSLGSLPYKEGRNPDIAEVHLTDLVSSNNGTTIGQLKFGRAYGFRNIQSIILKLKSKRMDLDFVELMACPSGCNNGGGQIKETGEVFSAPGESRKRIDRMEKLFHEGVMVQRPEDSPLVRYLFNEKRLGDNSDLSGNILHTRYHAVPKLEIIAPLAAKW